MLPSPLISNSAFTWVPAAGDSQRDSQDLPKKHSGSPYTHTHAPMHTCTHAHMHPHTHDYMLTPHTHQVPGTEALIIPQSQTRGTCPLAALRWPSCCLPWGSPLRGFLPPKVMPQSTQAFGLHSHLLALLRTDISKEEFGVLGSSLKLDPKSRILGKSLLFLEPQFPHP